MAIAEMARSAIEEAVSNPNPKRTPIGYIFETGKVNPRMGRKTGVFGKNRLTFHGRSTKVVIGPKILMVNV